MLLIEKHLLQNSYNFNRRIPHCSLFFFVNPQRKVKPFSAYRHSNLPTIFFTLLSINVQILNSNLCIVRDPELVRNNKKIRTNKFLNGKISHRPTLHVGMLYLRDNGSYIKFKNSSKKSKKKCLHSLSHCKAY